MPNTDDPAGLRTLGEQIRRARRARGLSQSALAAECGLTQATVSRIEGDRHPVTRGTLRSIAEALGVSLIIAPAAVAACREEVDSTPATATTSEAPPSAPAEDS